MSELVKAGADVTAVPADDDLGMAAAVAARAAVSTAEAIAAEAAAEVAAEAASTAAAALQAATVAAARAVAKANYVAAKAALAAVAAANETAMAGALQLSPSATPTAAVARGGIEGRHQIAGTSAAEADARTAASAAAMAAVSKIAVAVTAAAAVAAHAAEEAAALVAEQLKQADSATALALGGATVGSRPVVEAAAAPQLQPTGTDAEISVLPSSTGDTTADSGRRLDEIFHEVVVREAAARHWDDRAADRDAGAAAREAFQAMTQRGTTRSGSAEARQDRVASVVDRAHARRDRDAAARAIAEIQDLLHRPGAAAEINAEHDVNAALARDDAAVARDEAAEARDAAPHGVPDDRQAAGDRAHAAEDRAAAAVDREEAASDRQVAADSLRVAYRDELTGVLLRTAGREQMNQALDRAGRSHESLAFGFLDVDNLKRVNDGQGHAAGDLLLLEMGSALRHHLRSYDIVVRYGGDEFVCALPGSELADAELRLTEVGVLLGRTFAGAVFSIGLAMWQPGESLDDVVARADADLYDRRTTRKAAIQLP